MFGLYPGSTKGLPYYSPRRGIPVLVYGTGTNTSILVVMLLAVDVLLVFL